MIHVSDNLVASLLNIIQVSGKIVLNYFGKSKETSLVDNFLNYNSIALPVLQALLLAVGSYIGK